MSDVDFSNTEILQVDPDDLLATFPQFHAAGSHVEGASMALSNTLANALAAFDGNTQKSLQTLGNSCVTNLQSLSSALNEIANRLNQAAQGYQSTDNDVAKKYGHLS